ncbi:MAG: DUF1559 domain-containing protein [Thermoguttaceae bacterium]
MTGSRSCFPHRPNRGFTLVELLVVIAIIGILMALLLPAVQAAREAARRLHCNNNLKQLALGILAYENKYQVIPPGEIHGKAVYGSCPHCDWDGSIGMWMNLIFPFIDLEPFYKRLDFKIHPQYASLENQAVMKQEFPIFLCPSDGYRGLTTPWGDGGEANSARICHYYAVNGSDENSLLTHPDGTSCGTNGHCNAHDGMFYNDSAVRVARILDGQSQTAMLCEVWGRIWPDHQAPPVIPTGCWDYESSHGMNLDTSVYFDVTPNTHLGVGASRCNLTPWKASSFHVGGVNVAYADGSVHFIANEISLDVFKGLATIAGSEAILAPQ